MTRTRPRSADTHKSALTARDATRLVSSPGRCRLAARRAVLLVALSASLAGAAAVLADPGDYDFDDDGQVGHSDLALLEAALNGSDASFDVNDDGRVNFLDLALVKQNFDEAPAVAEFEYLGSSAEEGSGLHWIRVALQGEPAVDEVLFRVEGPATNGSDYSTTPSRKVAIQAGEAWIPVDLLDDDVIDGKIEWLTLVLEPGPGYIVGAYGEHTLVIHDNDAIWRGSFRAEDLNAASGASSLDFELEIVRTGRGTQGHIRGTGGLIRDDSLSQPLDSLTFSGTSFAASVDGLVLPQASTHTPDRNRLLTDAVTVVGLALTNGEVKQEAVCAAADAISCANPGEEIDVEVHGDATLTLGIFGAPHLDRSLTGTFVLAKQAPEPDDGELALEDTEGF